MVFKDLNEKNSFMVDNITLAACQDTIYAGWADEPEILQTIGQWYKETGYVFDTHSAIGVKVYEDYRNKTGDSTYTVLVSTASPFKFASSVLTGIDGKGQADDLWHDLSRLAETSGWAIPRGLQGLTLKPEQHVIRCGPIDISAVLSETFDI